MVVMVCTLNVNGWELGCHEYMEVIARAPQPQQMDELHLIIANTYETCAKCNISFITHTPPLIFKPPPTVFSWNLIFSFYTHIYSSLIIKMYFLDIYSDYTHLSKRIDQRMLHQRMQQLLTQPLLQFCQIKISPSSDGSYSNVIICVSINKKINFLLHC
mgnify:CR=1 FL=1